MKTGIDSYPVLAGAFAFVGNSLLKPMSQTETVGLDPEFWAAFPDFDTPAVTAALESLEAFARDMSDDDVAVTAVSVEFTKLFVGPPKPAAVPWESYYVAKNVTSGFGAPTFQMQQLLRDNGLALSGESNQLADHMGIELLLLSELCRKAVDEQSCEAAAAFAAEHPARWVDALREKAAEEFPNGYFCRLLGLARELMALL